jgi:hypothetical protein
MGDTTAEDLELLQSELARSDRTAYLEQRVFILSPFGTFATSALLFILAAGSYVLLAFADRLPIALRTPDGLALDWRARVAFILSLLVAVILGIQRSVTRAERRDFLNSAENFSGGREALIPRVVLTPAGARLGLASAIGLVLGAGLVALFVTPDNGLGFSAHPGVFTWYAIVIAGLVMAFTRGVELTRRGAQSGFAMIDKHLIIDLLRVDRLSFLGRSAARFALIWFTIAAVSCLFFVGIGVTKFTISLMAVFTAIGLWTFVAILERVHRMILRAKGKELERLRTLIDAVRQEAESDGDAAERLQGLLAYETRIAAAPEWPFDQTTLVRVGASVLILTVPWFGQAVAAYLIEHLGPR